MGYEPALDKLTIETPEQIPLDFRLAGIGSRFLALAVDTLIQFVVFMALLLVGLAVTITGLLVSSRVGIWVAACFVLLVFIVQFGYFALFEAIWNGQTPGKRRINLRVIKDNGQPISTYDAVARNLLRLVDSLPGFYGVGILSVLLSAKNKRLGDFVAGTVVVLEKPLDVQATLAPAPARPSSPSGYDVNRLAAEEFQLMESFLMRRKELPSEPRARLARQIIERLAPKLEISTEDQRLPEPLLEKLAAEYRNHTRYR